jgi:hypothetical protein
LDSESTVKREGNVALIVKTHLIGVKSFYQNFYIEYTYFTQGKNKTMPFGDNTDIPTKIYLLENLKVIDSLEKTVQLIG